MYNILNNPQLGELEVIEVYEYFNMPLLFSCKNLVDSFYVALCADDLPEHDMWLYTEISLKRLNLLRFGSINVHDVFAKPEMGRLLKATIPHNSSAEFNSKYVAPEELNESVFPPVNKYLVPKNTPLMPQTNSVEIIEKEQEKPFTIIGNLIGLSLATNRFEIQTAEKPIKGYFQEDANYSIKNATISRQYKATIKEVLKKNEVTDSIVKIEHLLLNLEEV